MAIEVDEEFRRHLEALSQDGFTLNPTGFERINQWTHMLMNLLIARQSFERVLAHDAELGDLRNILEQQAFFVAGVMAYCRCYASSGPSIPTLDASQVYRGSEDGKEAHRRLIEVRNTVVAHTDESDLIQVNLGLREDADKYIIRHLQTSKMPVNEVPDFVEAVAHTENFVFISLNKQLGHLGQKLGKPIHLD